mmetsp:Transcript_38644/g.86434  ORF Transcript_38644/g.86434 Transcript_38644/m.86434 type:complete len:305 (+) Transcript_38644:72-986(+)
MNSSGADAGAGGPSVPAPPHEAQLLAAASAPQSLPALPEEAEVGDGRREESDLLQYSQALGIDLSQHADLVWVVEEAFNAPLPLSWTEYTDDEGRVYFFNQSSSQSTWEHPMDAVYRELLSVIQRARESGVSASYEGCAAVVQNHLREVHQRALRCLEDWSGPYPAEEGEYYYNHRLKVSTWDCPVTEWEQELMTRQAVLYWCLLGPGRLAKSDAGASEAASGSDGDEGFGPDLLRALRLPLNLVRREAGGTPPSTPSTARSFHTARSMHSSRSQRSRVTAEDAERGSARGSPPSGSPREALSS